MVHNVSLTIPAGDNGAHNQCSCGWVGPTWLEWEENYALMAVEALRHRVDQLEKQFESFLR